MTRYRLEVRDRFDSTWRVIPYHNPVSLRILKKKRKTLKDHVAVRIVEIDDDGNIIREIP